MQGLLSVGLAVGARQDVLRWLRAAQVGLGHAQGLRWVQAMIDLRCGSYADVLADVRCDAVICDPPFGQRTHTANSGLVARFAGGDDAPRRDLSYDAWTAQDVAEFVAFWAVRCRAWIACMTSDDLIPAYRAAYAAVGLYDFAPVPCLYHRPRLAADGPGSGAIYLMVARPRRKEFLGYGSLPCWYGPIFAPRSTDPHHHIGGKPLEIMRAIVRDYSRDGDLVCDPTAGGATTAIAAAMEGRRFVGAELDPATWAKAQKRIANTAIPVRPLFTESAGVQEPLL